MSHLQKFNQHSKASGFTLIELMVAIVINLVLIVAASQLYVSSTESRKVQADTLQMQENGQFALELIGRDLINAGFYPMIMQLDANRDKEGVQAATIYKHGRYSNIVSTPTQTYAAFDNGVFGCDAQMFDPLAGQYVCKSHSISSSTADTLVVNYFTADALGKNLGSRLDCNRSNVSNAPENSGRAGAGKTADIGLQPGVPLFVSNKYTLQSMTFVIEGNTITTRSLSCAGNVDTTSANPYQPIVSGIEDLQIRYGVYTNVDTFEPAQFYRADQMASVPLIVFPPTGTFKGGSLNAWARVVSVEVCLVARGLQNSKLSEANGTIGAYADCSGNSVTPTDRDTRKVFRKTFALRNNLTQTIMPKI